ncbi:unnamed protein product [Chilo suppressalis]|uniref:DUF4371 domain-containing protein n=1 Tax=Chilo suppressalis TaxID=168631 RepID=A0ABN8B213_CHISP|nr:unnamed protein product [Chilo suppressalis]
MDGMKRLSEAEYRKRAKEKDDKQKDVINKTRKLDDIFVKPNIKDHIIDPTRDVPCGSGSATLTDVSSVSSTADTSIVAGSGSKEEAVDVPLITGVHLNLDQERCKISYDPAKWTIDDYFCKNEANQNIQNDFPKSVLIYKDKARQLSKHLFLPNMSGIYNDLQAKIKEISPLAEYVPCSAHSLNLVGECAAESTLEACSFISLLQELYNFIEASTQGWELLQTHFTIKSLSTTRWSARADACKSLRES